MGRGAHPDGRFSAIEISEIADFGRKSAFFDSNEAPAPQNVFRTMKIFLEADYHFFGAGRKFFGHPAPRMYILGLLKFRPKPVFGRKSGFSPFDQPGTPKRGEYPENVFDPKSSLEPLVCEKKCEKYLG